MIFAARFKRLLPAIARRLQIEPDELYALVEGAAFSCPICGDALPVPVLYRDGTGRARAAICGRCNAAIEKTGGDLTLLSKHRRFHKDHARNRGRLARFIALNSDPIG